MRTITHYLYIICSALLYTIPFIFPSYTWFLLFFYLAPIISISLNNRQHNITECIKNFSIETPGRGISRAFNTLPTWGFLSKSCYTRYYRSSFYDGFFWGLLVFTIHPIGIWFGITNMAATNSYQLCLLLLAIIIYYALCTGIWFALTDYIIRSFIKAKNSTPLSPELTKDNAVEKTIFVWLITTTLYIRWVESYSLSLFTNLSGYSLFSPLLPLTTYPKLLYTPYCFIHHFFSKTIFFSFFTKIISPKTIALFLLHLPMVLIMLWHYTKSSFSKSYLYLALFFCSIFTWLSGLIVPKQIQARPEILNAIAWLPFQGTGSETLALIVKQKYKNILAQKPETKLIILPESAFYTESLCSTPKNTALWNSTHITQKPYIICGSFSREKRNICLKSYIEKNSTNKNSTDKNKADNDLFFNTCYLIHDGSIIQKFHKKERVPLIEYIPKWLEYIPKLLTKNSLSQLFFQKLPAIDACDNTREPLIIGNLWRCIPYICSELLLQEYPDDQYPELPILALVNDAWVSSSYIKNSMKKLAQLKAIEWQRNILYISYSYAIYIRKDGSYYIL